jgi:hypothetical protein
MFCPNCRAEYRQGFTKCAECGIDLVDGKPPGTEDNVLYVEMAEVYSTYNPGDIAVIKSILDGENIHYYFQGENTNLMVGGGAYARLLVEEDQADRVRDILHELEFL